MTFKSLFVEQHDTEASAREAHVTGREYAVCGSLDARSWTPSVAFFAAAHDLPIDYVDNCWLRVAMDPTLLHLFLHGGPAGDQVHVCSTGWTIADGKWATRRNSGPRVGTGAAAYVSQSGRGRPRVARSNWVSHGANRPVLLDRPAGRDPSNHLTADVRNWPKAD